MCNDPNLKNTAIKLLIPSGEESSSNPEVSIVVPALNEEITIGEFIDWCWQGILDSGVSGEIIIVDSSSDRTADIALAKGARVLKTEKRGLGQAYIDSIPFIRGEYIVMGDCDLTYDFREISPFIERFREGAEFVMGSRFMGVIEKGAMPALHRYFGTPLTTWMLNKIYKSRYSDIHCGMRGITRVALKKINLASSGWEYASEMVLKATRLGLVISEVPVKFYKDREGRLSHHKRLGFWSPWYAGWTNVRVMFTYTPDSFLMKPGIVLICSGLVLSILSLIGDIHVGHIGFGPDMLVFGFSLVSIGYSLIQTAILARVIHQMRTGIEKFFMKYGTYNFGVTISILLMLIGIALFGYFLSEYIKDHFLVIANNWTYAISGLFLMIISVQTFGFTLIMELKRKINGINR